MIKTIYFVADTSPRVKKGVILEDEFSAKNGVGLLHLSSTSNVNYFSCFSYTVTEKLRKITINN